MIRKAILHMYYIAYSGVKTTTSYYLVLCTIIIIIIEYTPVYNTRYVTVSFPKPDKSGSMVSVAGCPPITDWDVVNGMAGLGLAPHPRVAIRFDTVIQYRSIDNMNYKRICMRQTERQADRQIDESIGEERGRVRESKHSYYQLNAVRHSEVV